MKAIVFHSYGQPDVLALEEIEKPSPGDGQILVKVYASSINSWDWELLQGIPFVNRMMSGLLRPTKIKIPGCDIAGRIESVGKNVKRFQVGDEVFGDLSSCGWCGFAEYVAAPEKALELKPACLTFEQAAAVPQAALLALQGLQKGGIQVGKKVLINGAGGGSGTFAIQIAKDIGAEVTAVDSTEKLDIMRATGADHVIDYTQEDFTKNGQRVDGQNYDNQGYDLIFDNAANLSLSDYKRALNPGGIHVMVGGKSFNIFKSLLVSMLGSRKYVLLLHKANKGLDTMKQLFEAGKVVPVIDRSYPLSEAADAMRYFAAGHAKGKVVITIEHN
jgi:NADPH:quinone reductase-like Zn-dependent oxidoreductase